MRSLSFLAAFVLTLAAPSMAGSAASGLPGIGTFSYTGSPVMMPAPAIVVAGLTRADRS